MDFGLGEHCKTFGIEYCKSGASRSIDEAALEKEKGKIHTSMHSVTSAMSFADADASFINQVIKVLQATTILQ